MGAAQKSNIASVSWGDHLVFGEGDGRLDTIAALKRRMEAWRRELGAGIIHWRCTRDRIRGRYYQGRGYRHFFAAKKPALDWDDFRVVPEAAHHLGMQAYLYVTLFDEGWPLPPKKVRQRSYHNRMHCRHVSWQSEFSRNHPQYAVVDRSGRRRQWGVLCLAFEQVRRHFIHRYLRLLEGGDFDGLFVCLRSQSRPADFGDQFGFNGPVRREYLKRYGKDILREEFDRRLWRDLLGEYLACFLEELRRPLRQRNVSLAVGMARGSILGPPLGNATLQWSAWVRSGIVDAVVIDQNSSRCPSMWHDLWPMHRGKGYLQNYLNGDGMRPLQEDLVCTYEPVFRGRPAKLYAARQWHERSEEKERELLRQPVVYGLVFSTFRHDNPGPVRRNCWVA